MSQTGYFGVVAPDRDFWQGFFIEEAYREAALDTIRRVRADKEIAGSKVFTRLDIPVADQSLIGSFCTTVLHAALAANGHHTKTHFDNPNRVLATIGYAISEIIRYRYFWIEARTTGEGTTYTKIEPVYVSDIKQARVMIHGMPVVRDIKRRLLSKSQSLPLDFIPASHIKGQYRTEHMGGLKPRRFPVIDQLIKQINAETRKR